MLEDLVDANMLVVDLDVLLWEGAHLEVTWTTLSLDDLMAHYWQSLLNRILSIEAFGELLLPLGDLRRSLLEGIFDDLFREIVTPLGVDAVSICSSVFSFEALELGHHLLSDRPNLDLGRFLLDVPDGKADAVGVLDKLMLNRNA